MIHNQRKKIEHKVMEEKHQPTGRQKPFVLDCLFPHKHTNRKKNILPNVVVWIVLSLKNWFSSDLQTSGYLHNFIKSLSFTLVQTVFSQSHVTVYI